MVDEAVAAVIKPSNSRIYTEVLRHLHTCQTFAGDFEGRQMVIFMFISSSLTDLIVASNTIICHCFQVNSANIRALCQNSDVNDIIF